MLRAVYLIPLVSFIFLCASAQKPDDDFSKWTRDFGIDKSDLSSTGSNPYFILKPGYQLVFEDEDAQLIITVLNETKIVDEVETRVVEERETEKGKLVEISRNYFAISKTTNSVFYFGENCDIYNSKGEIASHGGGWLAGVDGAKAGLMMPGLPLLGARYYQEVAPGVAMDRAEIISMTVKLKVPAGRFENVLKIEETTPLEPSEKEYKLYARGIGLLKDGSLELVKYGFSDK